MVYDMFCFDELQAVGCHESTEVFPPWDSQQ